MKADFFEQDVWPLLKLNLEACDLDMVALGKFLDSLETDKKSCLHSVLISFVTGMTEFDNIEQDIMQDSQLQIKDLEEKKNGDGSPSPDSSPRSNP